MSDDKQSKTEDPTDKKRSDARKEGNIPKSQDLVAWTTILLGITVLKTTVSKGNAYLQQLLKDMGEVIENPDQGRVLEFAIEALKGMVPVLMPLAVAFLVIAMLGHFAQVRFVIATKAAKPTFKKMNPIKGFKRIFSKKSVVEAAKQLLKAVVICYIAYRTLYTTLISLTIGGPYATGEVIRVTVEATVDFLMKAAMAGLVIGVADYFYQRKSSKDNMKMTKQAVKDEHKEGEGNPEVKGQIKQKQRQMSRNRMMAAIKDADVVVVNPVHIAIALKYESQKGAPRVVAKGAGFVAEKIREKAQENAVPVVQDILLARTLHRVCDIDDEIPGEMFSAVAQVLAFVFTLKTRGMADGFHRMPGSADMAEADVLDEKRKQEEAEASRKLAEERFGPSASESVTVSSR